MSHDDDGRGPPSQIPIQNGDQGQMLLTLVLVDSASTEYPHATIPFAESYEIACEQVMRVFAAYLKANDTILLKHATRRVDGTVVWSTVTGDDWSRVIKRNGEEIGVLIPRGGSTSYTANEELPRKPGYNMIRMHYNGIAAPILHCDNLQLLQSAAWERFAFVKDPVLSSNVRIFIKAQSFNASEEIASTESLRYYLLTHGDPLNVTVHLSQ